MVSLGRLDLEISIRGVASFVFKYRRSPWEVLMTKAMWTHVSGEGIGWIS